MVLVFSHTHYAITGVREFARRNLPGKKRVFLINTYSFKGDYTKEMKQIIEEKSCQLLGTYGCRGFNSFGPFKLVGGVAKGYPNERDVNGAREFFRGIIDNSSKQSAHRI